ncbi:hypothetical protein [Homoserinimonas hongtaonis]|nr:hypothetical protein [Salinibacterium hongtaonis]
MQVKHETVTVWLQGAVPVRLLWRDVRYMVTDTPTGLYGYIDDAPTRARRTRRRLDAEGADVPRVVVEVMAIEP